MVKKGEKGEKRHVYHNMSITTGGGDGGGRVEDVTIFVRSDKTGQDQERVHQRNSASGTVWTENTRGKTEVIWTCTEE